MSHDTQATDAPPDHGQAQARDEAFARDAEAMVQVYRSDLEWMEASGFVRVGARLMVRLGRVIEQDRALSHEESTLAFCDGYGLSAVLRALARAIEQHEAGTPRPEA